ncbi:MAG: Asd/ArgC dimerization domain-containing protein [Candidatus Acidiferrales bacterium]
MPGAESGLRIAIVGATSLRGKELKEALEASALAAAEVRLVDDDLYAGTITEVGGEPTVVGPAGEEDFSDIRFVFFAGTPELASRHAPAALAAGATLIDLTGGLATLPEAMPWIPTLDSVLPPPRRTNGSAAAARVYLSPSVTTITACAFAAALSAAGGGRGQVVFLQPVSERGQAAVEELERQTVQLLSMQPAGHELFDAQIAFNILDRYGPASPVTLLEQRQELGRDVARYLAGRVPIPAVALLQAPVFFSHAFIAYGELDSAEAIVPRLTAAGFKFADEDDPSPSNVSVAGEPRPVLGRPARDPNVERGWWFWGAADNMRVAAANAVSIAERLRAS